MAYSSIKKWYWKKKKARLNNWGSESAVFVNIAKKQNMICQLTWEYLPTVYPYHFAHIVPKWMYPEFRLDPNNIIFVKSLALHHRVDEQVSWNKAKFIELVKEWKAIQYLQDLYNQNPPVFSKEYF